ncbi:hypothetical protein BDW59DRAFT_175608 [Aspergillus cavernicola]|uniref:Uncharacterized protein n=1 Tax=Aspergillus cavernicola TaxID=176166 RepID=A0ABR4HNU1_9EURO
MAQGLDYLPSWGQLPVEQYLIESWTPASTEQAPTQRARLVKQFLNLDQLNPDWDPTGGASDPDAQPPVRAWRVWQSYNNAGGNNPVLPRTWYDSADDERVKSWATLSEEYADDADWAILDDSHLFAFGENWQRVYDILPEIAMPHVEANPSKCSRRKDWPISDFKQGINAVKRSNPFWREDLNILVRDNAAALELLHAVSKSYILIADKETFETDHFLLAYLDAKGRVTMQGRILVDEDRLSEVSLEWFERKPLNEVFEEGTLGEEYVVVAGNEVDREVYGWTRGRLIEWKRDAVSHPDYTRNPVYLAS